MIDSSKAFRRRFDASSDLLDLRDRWYASALASPPPRRSLTEYQRQRTPVLDQGSEGACAAFAVATAANYLTRAGRDGGAEPVSVWMLHEMGRRSAEGAEDDAPSVSLRCVLKGWHRHGVCGRASWPDRIADSEPALTAQRAADAATRPLAAYFRIDHRDFSSLHAALTEAGVLLATAWIHDGWLQPDSSGVIRQSGRRIGSHSFTIAAYDQDGLWIQNSWGRHWGHHGFGYLDYDQWLRAGIDVWATQMGAAVRLQAPQIREPQPSYGDGPVDLRSHVISLDRDGRLRRSGRFGNTKADVEAIFRNDIPRVTDGWDRPRLLLHAGGALGSEDDAIDLAARWAPGYLRKQIYPITLLWRGGIRSSVDSLLRIALREPELAQSPARDWPGAPPREDALEALLRRSLGKTLWDEIKSGSLHACARPAGGLRLLAGLLAHRMLDDGHYELHVSAHGAGALMLAPLVLMLTTRGHIRSAGLAGTPGFDLRIATCTLSAPLCTPEFFHATFGASIAADGIASTTLVVLEEEADRDDAWSEIYRRSFLRLVSSALEERRDARLVGDAAVARRDAPLRTLIRSKRLQLVFSPNDDHGTSASRARTHDGLESDEAAQRAAIARIVQRGGSAVAARRLVR